MQEEEKEEKGKKGGRGVDWQSKKEEVERRC